MASFVITAVFEVESSRAPLGKDVVARPWGAGHRFSHCDGRMLTLVVEVSAPDSGRAFEMVRSRAVQVWEGLCGQTLPAPSTLRLHGVVPQEKKVVAGAVGRGPDLLIAEAVADRAAELRAAVAALSALSAPSDLQRLPDLQHLPDLRRAVPRSGSGAAAVVLALPPPFPIAE